MAESHATCQWCGSLTVAVVDVPHMAVVSIVHDVLAYDQSWRICADCQFELHRWIAQRAPQKPPSSPDIDH